VTNSIENKAREAIVEHGRSLHVRGFVPGSSGNISVRLSDGFLVTPTRSCLGRLDPAQIAKLDLNGQHVSGEAASKEAFLHTQMYSKRQSANAVVHLHSTHAVAVSCLRGLTDENAIRPLTAYFVMQIGQLKVLPYFPPGDEELAHAVAAVAQDHHAILLANHGPVVAGTGLDAAVYAIEELEEAARLDLLLEGRDVNALTAEQIAALQLRFPS
jgi:ribulose-5-phosphate 4-epimerase/fuculose-1-phosphate aldolase